MKNKKGFMFFISRADLSALCIENMKTKVEKLKVN